MLGYFFVKSIFNLSFNLLLGSPGLTVIFSRRNFRRHDVLRSLRERSLVCYFEFKVFYLIHQIYCP
jgi:hypothetical protein